MPATGVLTCDTPSEETVCSEDVSLLSTPHQQPESRDVPMRGRLTSVEGQPHRDVCMAHPGVSPWDCFQDKRGRDKGGERVAKQ